MILGETEYTGYRDAEGCWVSPDQSDRPGVTATKLIESQVTKKGEGFVLAEDLAVRIEARAHKMSKARGNVINPDTIVAEYGADSLRLYEMFMGPLEAVKPWSMKGVEGVYRFLARAWRMIVDAEADVVRLDDRVCRRRHDSGTIEGRRANGGSRHRRLRIAEIQYGNQPADGIRQLLYFSGNVAPKRR